MTMEEEKVFQTKTGFCHILPDRLVLTRDGVVGSVSQVVVGNRLGRILIIYGLAVAFFLFMAFSKYQEGKLIEATFFLVFSLFHVLIILASRNNSAAPVIERSRIRKVVLKKAVPGLTRTRFEVFFEDEKGRIKKRMILLPGTLTGGQEETKKAVKLMQEAGLIEPK